MEQLRMDENMGCFSLHVPVSPTSEQMDFLERLLACIMQHAGPSLQIIVDPKIRGCLDGIGNDFASDIAAGIVIPHTLEDCIEGDPEDIETLDDFIEAADLGIIICLQVCGDWCCKRLLSPRDDDPFRLGERGDSLQGVEPFFKQTIPLF